MQIEIKPELEKPLKVAAEAANTTPTRHANAILAKNLPGKRKTNCRPTGK